MQTESQKAVSALILARRNASPLAIQAEGRIEEMFGSYENFYVVLSALIEKSSRQTWADFSLVLHHLDEALSAMSDVVATTPEERAEFERNEMQGERDE